MAQDSVIMSKIWGYFKKEKFHAMQNEENSCSSWHEKIHNSFDKTKKPNQWKEKKNNFTECMDDVQQNSFEGSLNSTLWGFFKKESFNAVKKKKNEEVSFCPPKHPQHFSSFTEKFQKPFQKMKSAVSTKKKSTNQQLSPSATGFESQLKAETNLSEKNKKQKQQIPIDKLDLDAFNIPQSAQEYLKQVLEAGQKEINEYAEHEVKKLIKETKQYLWQKTKNYKKLQKKKEEEEEDQPQALCEKVIEALANGQMTQQELDCLLVAWGVFPQAGQPDLVGQELHSQMGISAQESLFNSENDQSFLMKVVHGQPQDNRKAGLTTPNYYGRPIMPF